MTSPRAPRTPGTPSSKPDPKAPPALGPREPTKPATRTTSRLEPETHRALGEAALSTKPKEPRRTTAAKMRSPLEGKTTYEASLREVNQYWSSKGWKGAPDNYRTKGGVYRLYRPSDFGSKGAPYYRYVPEGTNFGARKTDADVQSPWDRETVSPRYVSVY